MKRDLQIGLGAAFVTAAPGFILWTGGVPTTPCILLSLATAVALLLALGRRWYRQVLARVNAQAEHLQSAIGIAATSGGIPIYWSEHAITPETLKLVQHLADSLGVRSVLELGSGISTLVLSNDFRRRGAGRVLSFDDDARWAEQSRLRLHRENLDGIAEVRVAPLVEVEAGGRRSRWYDLAGLDPDARFDLILVDGPPSWQGDPMARLPALYKLRRHLSENGLLVLDDAARSGERAVAERWRRDFPDLHFRMVHTGRGLFVASVQESTLDLLPH